MLELLSVFHQQGYGKQFVHKDVSPGNFIMTPEGDLYIIDLETSMSAGFTEFLGNPFTGTVAYMSVPAMREEKLNTSQDLESVVYVLSLFYERTLPWLKLDGVKDREKIIKLKEDFIPKHPELRDLLEELREK